MAGRPSGLYDKSNVIFQDKNINLAPWTSNDSISKGITVKVKSKQPKISSESMADISKGGLGFRLRLRTQRQAVEIRTMAKQQTSLQQDNR